MSHNTSHHPTSPRQSAVLEIGPDGKVKKVSDGATASQVAPAVPILGAAKGAQQQQQQNQPGKGGQGKGKSKLVCHFWQRGACKKGEQCTYAHPPAEKGVGVKPVQGSQTVEQQAAAVAAEQQGQQLLLFDAEGNPSTSMQWRFMTSLPRVEGARVGRLETSGHK